MLRAPPATAVTVSSSLSVSPSRYFPTLDPAYLTSGKSARIHPEPLTDAGHHGGWVGHELLVADGVDLSSMRQHLLDPQNPAGGDLVDRVDVANKVPPLPLGPRRLQRRARDVAAISVDHEAGQLLVVGVHIEIEHIPRVLVTDDTRVRKHPTHRDLAGSGIDHGRRAAPSAAK